MNTIPLIKPKFVLDSSIFIEAHRRKYPIDVMPTFWEQLKTLAQSGKICTIEPVLEEIRKIEDELTQWFMSNFSSYTHPVDTIQYTYTKVVNFTSEFALQQEYRVNALDEFLDGADPWLIAFAKHYSITLVTEERYDPNIRKKVPIPIICEQFEVEWCDTIKMLRELGVQI